jgi:hypothetical protein
MRGRRGQPKKRGVLLVSPGNKMSGAELLELIEAHTPSCRVLRRTELVPHGVIVILDCAPSGGVIPPTSCLLRQ